MKIRLNDYETKDIIRILREWTELDRAEFGKSVKKSANTIKITKSVKVIIQSNFLKN